MFRFTQVAHFSTVESQGRVWTLSVEQKQPVLSKLMGSSWWRKHNSEPTTALSHNTAKSRGFHWGNFTIWQFSTGVFNEIWIKRSFLLPSCESPVTWSSGSMGSPRNTRGTRNFLVRPGCGFTWIFFSQGAKSKVASHELNQARLVSDYCTWFQSQTCTRRRQAIKLRLR